MDQQASISFWVVQSNKPVLQTINKLNSRKAAKSINTFDLSTLYTKLPHDKPQTMFHKFKDFCFDEEKNNFILLNYFGAFWVKENIKTVRFALVSKI